eukprot:7263431-Pyramimonas_sp.AAC.1
MSQPGMQRRCPAITFSPPHLPPAAAASFPDRKDTWTQQGQSLKRWHFVPRLVTFMPVTSDCPIGPERLDDRR